MGIKKFVFVAVLPVLFLVGCGLQKPDEWRGYYYPDASNLLMDVNNGMKWRTLDECRDWVADTKAIYNPDGTNFDDYECCLNGKYQPDYDMMLCDETSR